MRLMCMFDNVKNHTTTSYTHTHPIINRVIEFHIRTKNRSRESWTGSFL